MMKRNIMLLITAFVMSGLVEAQVRFGIKTGYNFNGVIADYVGAGQSGTNKAGNPDNFHFKPGFQIGVLGDWMLNETLAVQPGLRFTMQGFVDEYTSGSNIERKFSLYYLQLPVNAQYKFSAGPVNIVAQAGPYLGYGLFARQSYFKKGASKNLSDEDKKIKFGNGSADDIWKAFDYGVGAGVGVEYGGLQLMVEYGLGLNKMTFNKNMKSAYYKINMQNTGLSITLAYIFGKKIVRPDED